MSASRLPSLIRSLIFNPPNDHSFPPLVNSRESGVHFITGRMVERHDTRNRCAVARYVYLFPAPLSLDQ